MRTCVIIPAYNAEKHIYQIAKDSRKYVSQVIVVNNNSKDNTRKEAQRSGVTVLNQNIQGQGAATRKGFEAAHNNDIIVTLDGDGQHDVTEMLEVMKPVMNGEADISIGSRFLLSYDAPKYRKFGIDVITWIYNFGHKDKLNDTQSCFRAYNRKALDLIKIEENGFGFSTEILVKARKYGLRMKEVPIKCIYTALNENSTMNPIKHGLGVAWKTLIWRIKLWN
jgi:glycosyltransferase involved in cell wall biosynthesis